MKVIKKGLSAFDKVKSHGESYVVANREGCPGQACC